TWIPPPLPAAADARHRPGAHDLRSLSRTEDRRCQSPAFAGVPVSSPLSCPFSPPASAYLFFILRDILKSSLLSDPMASTLSCGGRRRRLQGFRRPERRLPGRRNEAELGRPAPM